MEDTKTIHSPFYDLLQGAQEFDLTFPVDENGEGPHSNEHGDLIWQEQNGLAVVRILAVPLGGGFYRLAENPLLEPLTELKWGDEFEAKEEYPGQLNLVKVVLPKKYHHEFGLISGHVTQGSSLSNRIHELEGGWETVAGGMLTITLPVDAWSKFPEWKRSG